MLSVRAARHGQEHRPEYRKGIAALLGTMSAESYVVYRGDRALRVDGTHVLPVQEFLRRLHAGDVLG